MSDYWLKCPLDLKEKIQQYLVYNLHMELMGYWFSLYSEKDPVNNVCFTCDISLLHKRDYIYWKLLDNKFICPSCHKRAIESGNYECYIKLRTSKVNIKKLLRNITYNKQQHINKIR